MKDCFVQRQLLGGACLPPSRANGLPSHPKNPIIGTEGLLSVLFLPFGHYSVNLYRYKIAFWKLFVYNDKNRVDKRKKMRYHKYRIMRYIPRNLKEVK